MKLNTEVLKTVPGGLLRKIGRALEDYVATKPSHGNGLCYYLRTAADTTEFYDIDDKLRGDGAPMFVGNATGYTQERAEYAAAVAWAIAAELKRREEPKAPKVPTINLKKSSLQRIFEFGLKHVRKQGKPAMRGSDCAMRGEAGTMCVVGSMIDDELAQQCDGAVMPSRPSPGSDEWFVRIGKNEKKYTLLGEMQSAHDAASRKSGAFMPEFERGMQGVADRFGLTYKAPGSSLRT